MRFHTGAMTNDLEGWAGAEGRSDGGRLETALAASAEDLQAAQRLRYRVFAEEMGARVDGPAPGLDGDEFDEHCEHLLLRNRATGEVVGTYRLLPAVRARAVGRFYSATEFEIGALEALPGLVEIGRSCVDPRHRHGAALGALLAGLARHIRASGYLHVMGCASVAVTPDAP